MLSELTCEVCEIEPAVGVASSSIGPVSLAFGRNCLNNLAEPLWCWEASMGCQNQDELCKLVLEGGLNEAAEKRSVYVDGKYMTIRAWAEALDVR